jgi:hypothetical protein
MPNRLPGLATRFNAIRTATKTQFPGLAETGSDANHLDAAIEWLDHSCEISGGSGSAATYNLLLGWEEPYPETSGYIISTFYRYADWKDDEQFSVLATELAEWLLQIQHSDGSFPGGTGEEGDPNVFNTGQITLGLVEAYERTGENKFKNAVHRACDWLVDVQADDGSWSEYDYKSTTHIYSTRVAWALLRGAEMTTKQEYETAARKNLAWALEHRRENGWFEKASFEPGETPYLHTIAYTIRGFIECGRMLDESEIYEAGKRTADVLLELQKEDGILNGAYNSDWSPAWFYCLPGNAQMAINWLRLYEFEGDDEYLLEARSTAEFLKRHQPMVGPDAVRGGLPGSYPFVGDYIFLRYPNWGAKFLADLFLELQTATVDIQPEETDQTDTCRVCLLVDGEHVQRWAAEAIEQMLDETNAEISLVVINEDSGLLGRDNIKRGIKYPAYAVYWIASEFLSSSDSESFDDPIHISKIAGVPDARWIRTYPANVDGLWCELSDEVVEEISQVADVVVRRGFGLLTGDILTATKYGVLSYHHGDPRAYRGGPAGFWEFMHDTPHVGFMVQSLRDSLDDGIVQAYDEIEISDCATWREVQERVYPNSTHLLAEAIERVQNPESEPVRISDHGPVYNPPSAVELGRFALKSGSPDGFSVDTLRGWV